MLRRLFGPANSIILAYDHLTPEGASEMESQVEEVARFYRFVKLSELVASRSFGLASVVFLNPRKSVQLRGLPLMEGKKIPATLFIQPDCVGMNRLPPEEELDAFRRAYPNTPHDLPPADKTDAFLKDLRKSLGPLPVEKLDPTLFFTTWGKLLHIPTPLREFGLHLNSGGVNSEGIPSENLRYLETQVREKVTLAYTPKPPVTDLRRDGLIAIVTAKTGLVDKTTPKWCLPTYKFEAEGVT